MYIVTKSTLQWLRLATDGSMRNIRDFLWYRVNCIRIGCVCDIHRFDQDEVKMYIIRVYFSCYYLSLFIRNIGRVMNSSIG